jgi:two-component system cell cycle response regulator CtrA
MIRTGKLVVNLGTRSATVDGKPLHLTDHEYGILELLSLRKGTAVTREMFLNHLYGGMDERELKIIDVFVCKLRKKLAQSTGGEHYIESLPGRGYLMRDPKGPSDPVDAPWPPKPLRPSPGAAAPLEYEPKSLPSVIGPSRP